MAGLGTSESSRRPAGVGHRGYSARSPRLKAETEVVKKGRLREVDTKKIKESS